MALAHLSHEERIGLGVALGLHVLLAVVLILQPNSRQPLPQPERMTVNLATDVGLQAQAPAPVPDSRAAMAPELAPEPAPLPQVQPAPEPPRPVATTAPKPKPAPKSVPQPKTVPPKPVAKQAPAKSAPSKKAGGSLIGSNFLAGSGSSTTTDDTRIPASQIGPSARASVVQAIIRQIKPHWQAPQGADADLLVTVLSFRLNPDGSLAGTPRVVSQSGVTASNRPQAPLHAERAIRAVELAAPFNLPPEYYNVWKTIDGAKFDRNLSK
ncbi:energy transducer TonB [Tsuneonella mangrovi]|uniref:energy transducer TonB n=1 Tax=Tsuneonella mangrovi TaxID=1982042 RepID=UPI000BA22136|nr:energy transducer TonB [Tsuneonella mangrovi]